MVLNPKDFDFLQSRGANSDGLGHDQRDSLLLRFDPLARLSILKAQLQRPVQIIEETERDSNSTVIITPASSDQKASLAEHTTNEQPSDGILIDVAMDDETNSFVNNIRWE